MQTQVDKHTDKQSGCHIACRYDLLTIREMLFGLEAQNTRRKRDREHGLHIQAGRGFPHHHARWSTVQWSLKMPISQWPIVYSDRDRATGDVGDIWIRREIRFPRQPIDTIVVEQLAGITPLSLGTDGRDEIPSQDARWGPSVTTASREVGPRPI